MTQTTTTPACAIYMEFTKAQSVWQVLILPEGQTSKHTTAPMTMYRRRLTTTQPRKTWQMIGSAHRFTPTSLTVQTREAVAEQMLSFIDPLMSSLKTNGWKLNKQPVVVETSIEDFDAAITAKTPYKALSRVFKARKALGFPKEFIPAAV